MSAWILNCPPPAKAAGLEVQSRAQLCWQRDVNLEVAFSPVCCQLPALPLKQVGCFQSASSHGYATDKENAALTSTKMFMYVCGQNKVGRFFPSAELHFGKQAVMKHSDKYGPNNFDLFIVVNVYKSWHV